MQYLRREMYPIFEEWTSSNGEHTLIMTTKDFRDCPDSEEEYYMLEDLKFPYDSLDSDESIDSEQELMENKKLHYGQWTSSSLYPPPPSSKPPHLFQTRKDHRSPPTGGPDRVPSPSTVLKGNLVSDNSKLPIPGSRSGSRILKASPPIITSSPCPSSSSESCTTPTNELGERGSPAGASSSSSTTSSNIPKSKIFHKQRPPSNSQPVELNGSHIEAGILLSPQLKRTSRFSSTNKLDARGYYPKMNKQGFLQKSIPTVASRIKQFEASKVPGSMNKRQSYIIEEGRQMKSDEVVEEQNGIDIKNIEKSLPPNELRKSSLDLSSKSSTEEVDLQLQPPPTDVSDTSNLPGSTEEQQKMDQMSQTSSMEELSLINSEHNRRPRPEAIVPPHKHTPPFNPHYPIVYPSKTRNQQSQVSTFITPPTQPVAATSYTFKLGKPSYPTIDQPQRLIKPSTPGQQPIGGTPPGQQQPLGITSASGQPLGITTATLAVAHNAAANGDVATLHKLLSSGEVNILDRDDFGSTLLHTACTYGHISTLQLVAKEIPSSALLIADNNFLTPPLLAIQGGHLECLKFLIEEMGVLLTVPDAGGETLLHHASFHGQVKCLEYLLHRAKLGLEPFSYVDESGVSPAHFAAQRGHLDCIRLLINSGFDVTSPDRENMKPADWADATGQHSCTQYLVLYELCLQLSNDVSVLLHERHILRQENNQLHELLDLRDKEHHTAIAKLHQQHQETIHKVHEKYAGITVSALLRGDQSKDHNTSSSKGSGSSPVHRSSISNGKVKSEVKEKKKVKIIPEPLTIQEIPPTTPHEFLQRQLSNVEERLNASREMRKHHPVMATRSFSPLSPIVKRMNSQESDTDKSDNETNSDDNTRYQTSFLFAPADAKITNYQQTTAANGPVPMKATKSPPQETSDVSRQHLLQRSEQNLETLRQYHHPLRKSPPQDQIIDGSRYPRKSPPQDQIIDGSRYPRKSPPQDQIIDGSRYPRKSPPQDHSDDHTHHHHQPSQKSPPRDDSSSRDSHYLHHPKRTSPQEQHMNDTRHTLYQQWTQPPNENTSSQKSPQHKSQLLVTNKGAYSKSYAGHYGGSPHHQARHSTSIESNKHSSYPKYSQMGHRSYSTPNKDGGPRDSHPLTVVHTSPQHTRSKSHK